MRTYFVAIFIVASIYSYGQHSVRLNNGNKLYLEIVELSEDYVSIQFRQNPEKQQISRDLIHSISYLGFDSRLIKKNISLKRPYTISNLELNDELEFSPYKVYDGLNYKTLNVKVLDISEDRLTFVHSVLGKLSIDYVNLNEVVLANYSEETMHYTINKIQIELASDQILWKNGEAQSVYIYEFGRNGIIYTESKIDSNYVVLDSALNPIITPFQGAKFASYDQLVRASTYSGHHYLSQVSYLSNKNKNDNIFKTKIAFELRLSLGTNIGKRPAFFNVETVDGVEKWDDASSYKTYFQTGIKANFILGPQYFLEFGYSINRSSTVKTSEFNLETNNLQEYVEYTNYQNNLNLVHLGAGYYKGRFITSIAMLLTSSKQEYINEISVYENFQPLYTTVLEGHSNSKLGIGAEVNIGLINQIGPFQINPYVSLLMAQNNTTEVHIVNAKSTDPTFTIQEVMKFDQFSHENLFYMPGKFNALNLSLGISIRYLMD